eukprot:jgi/Mesen1/10830/ME000093S10345
MSTSAKLKSIDFYRKIPRDLTEATLSGAGLSIVAAIAMVFLFGMELNSYLTLSTRTDVVVDQSFDASPRCRASLPRWTSATCLARFNLSKTVRKHPVDEHFNVVGGEHHPDPVPTPSKHGNNPEHAVALEAGDTGALTLTEADFDEVVVEYPVLLVNFFAPWCPWSRRLEPAWEKAASILFQKYNPDADGRIRLAKVDCTIHAGLCRKHHIQGFPSIRVFRKGQDIREDHGQHEHESYYGERDTESLVAFAEKLLPSAVIEGRQALEDHSGHLRRAPQSSGCNIEGFVLVKKVPGNLMVSAVSGAHSFDASTMNMTHNVHSFSFGRPLTKRKQDLVERYLPPSHHLVQDRPGRITNHFFLSHHDNVTHDHYLQVVMTEVEPLHMRDKIRRDHRLRQSMQTYDYTAHSSSFQSGSVPVARFHYELSPMQVMIYETRRSFWHFITNVCAIIGGVFTVAGIVDGMLHHTLSLMKKMDLGKQF